MCYALDQQGGKGSANFQIDVSPTILSDSHGTPHAVAYGISSYASNAMLSDNPHSGIYEADTARTLDLNGGSPACNHGGIVVLEGNGARPSHQGDGFKAGGIGAQEECAPTLSAVASGTNQVPAVLSFAQNQVGEVRASPVSGTLNTNSNATGRNAPLVYDARGNGDGEIAPTMTGDHQNRVTDYTAVCVGNGQLNQMSMVEQANTLDTMHDQQAVMIAAVDCRNGTENPQTNGTLQAKSTGGIGVNFQNVCRVEQTVRRLTPLECERLQGFPDGWTDVGEWVDSKGKKHKPADSPRYKALGNSIALPFWAWLARRICAMYERPMTLGSLFDGIGGFPLVFERAGAKAVWASEIEEFCVAVTKTHFPERGENL